MTEITFDSEPGAELLQSLATDLDVVEAAQVSVKGVQKEIDMTEKRKKGLVGYLLKNRHGSPFEHNFFKFRVVAPIFVAREFMRHRIGFSYNEISGRYAELPGKFYIPSPERPLINEGSGAHPNLVPGDDSLYQVVECLYMDSYNTAWDNYQVMLNAGVATEVARNVLPVGLYTEFIVSCNARSIMSFISLRTCTEEALIKGHPLYEIEMVARDMEEALAEKMPYTYEHFTSAGRVAP